MTDEGSRAILRGHCPTCDADRNAEVLAEHTVEQEDEASAIWYKGTHSILRCLGCDKRYFRLAELCSEDWDEGFDPGTGETSLALNQLHILATIGIRTVFDCASQKLGSDPNQSFAEKLKELTAANKIGGEEKEMLSVLADAGSAAAHRGWKPPEDDIDDLMDALENFLHRAFVLKHNVRRVKKNIPARVDGH